MNPLILIGRATGTSLILLALAACSESPESPRQISSFTPTSSKESPRTSDGGGAIDPCKLLTDEEIERTTGYPVLSKKTVTGSGTAFSPPGCVWELKSGKGMPGLHRISIDVIRSGGRERFKLMNALTPVAGLGDGAVKTGGNMDGTVWAVAGDFMATLRYALPVDTADPDPLVLPLVKIILSRQ